jgi:hypothetical protein
LISWSRSELPDAVFTMRIAQTQAAMTADGIDALVVYTNIARSAGASWLTGFVPYWSEGLLVLPRAGRPVLFVALSKRVQGWIERTSAVEAVTCTPRFAQEAAAFVAAANPAARIGVLELDTLPTGTASALTGEGGTLVDATALYERLRAAADPAEIALTVRAAEIARDAAGALDAGAPNVAAVIAAVDGAARLAGAEDVFVAVAADLARGAAFARTPFVDGTLGATFAVRTTLAYKGHWVRSVRTIARTAAGAEALRLANERFADAVARLPDTSALAAAEQWLIEGTLRSEPLEAFAGSTIERPAWNLDGKLVSITAVYVVNGERVAVGGVAVVGSAWRPSALLVSL